MRLQVAIAGLALLCGIRAAGADRLPTARATHVMGEVRLALPGGAPQALSGGDGIAVNGSEIRAAGRGRAELLLPNGALLRLGGNTTARVQNRLRELQLLDGLVLFRAPRTARGARVTTGQVSVEVAGATGLIERFGPHYFKVLVLEGTARVFLPRLGESVLVEPGQMLISKPDARVLPDPVHFNIEHLYRTSALVRAPFRQLPSHSAIQAAIRQQKNDPRFNETNLMIFGRGTLVNLLPPDHQPAPPKEKPRR